MTEYPVADFEYKLKICDHILDNIYGQIGLTELEKNIERLPIFKRLHNISQLGLVNWIFPCALHTRYTHSIGVMYIAGEMASHINANMKEDFFCDSEIQILRLTGLLHDIGHYPLSHNIEFAYKDSQQAKKYNEESISQNLKHFINCPEFLSPDYCNPQPSNQEEIKDKSLENEEKFFKGFNGSNKFHHENISRLIIINNEDIRNAIKDNFVLLKSCSKTFLNAFFAPIDENGCKKKIVTDEEIERIITELLTFISNLVIGNYGYEKDMSCYWMRKYSAMIQLIHSDLDADNLDYLLRDATFSGTSYGIMDMSILLNCLYIKKFVNTSTEFCNNNHKSMKYLVGITKKGIGAVEQFLLGKFMAYSQMIFSKYVSILEAMILRIESENIIPNDKIYSDSFLMEMVKRKKTDIKYLGFSDFYIFDKLFSLVDIMTGLKKLPRAIISHLVHSCAFDLEASIENECICVGTKEEDIIKEFKDSSLYQNFVDDYYHHFKNKLGAELSNNEDLDAKLFSYRFEQYFLTEQIPIEEFINKYAFLGMNLPRRFNIHYYRLGKGIPILNPQKDYEYLEMENLKPDISRIPPLCVDSPSSALKDMRNMQFVALRKYKICDYVS